MEDLKTSKFHLNFSELIEWVDLIFICCSGHVIAVGVGGLWSLSSWTDHPSPVYSKGYVKRTIKQQRRQQQKILTNDRRNAPTTEGAVRATEWSSATTGARSRSETTPTRWRWTVFLVPRIRTDQTALKNLTVDDLDPSKNRLSSSIIRSTPLSQQTQPFSIFYSTFVYFFI